MSADDIFVVLGSPLPQPKKTTLHGDNKKPNPARDLEVRDEHGRRRFHGAFTGGFSAGYFNTVGSKEGWTPSEFVSSRGSRSETKTARPEDFMDEEDKQMLSDATRLAATEDFGTLGSTQRELARKRAAARSMQASGSVLGALPDALIDDLIIPSSELIGVRLLKRMGWRQGQGIGPRVSRRQRKPEDGPYSDDDTPVNATFAPIDSAVILFAHKANHFGLGFDPYKDAPEFNHLKQAQSESGYLSTVGSRVPKTGFGFGVLGDSDDEDDDVYSSGPKQGRFAEQEPGISGIPNKRQRHFNSSASSKPTSTSSLFCSDGRPPLAGFILSPAKPQSLKWYAAPVVPHDFIPLHEFSSSSKTTDPVKQQGRSKLTADDRALALGETPIDAPRRSVFEYMSAENKNRLDGILGFVLDTEGEKHQRKDHWEVPKMEKSAAEAALQGFMPFADNISKQHRYKQYLNIQAGLSEETIERVEGFSGEDMTKELNEFLQAARIFKPMSSSMASRFTSASKVVEFVQPAAGLRSADDIQSRLSEKASPEHRVVERGELPKSQAAKAAAMGMFGPLTRSTVDFFPNKLLCKRFNVPNPHPDHKNVGPDAAKDLLGKATMDRMMMEGNLAGVPLSNEVSMGAQGEVQTMSDLAAEGPAEELEQQFEAGQAMQERPPMDIFKAIFDDSDSDSDSDSYPDVEQTGIPSEGDGVASGAAAVQQRGHEQEQEAETTMRMENALEGAPAIPFRPIFTRKTDREGRPSSSRPRSPNRASKIGLRHVDNPDGEEDREEEDGDGEMGPRLDFSKRKVARGGTSRKPTFIGSSQHPNKDQDTATTFDDHHSRSGEFIGPPVEPAHVSQATLAGVKDSAHEGQGCNKDGGSQERDIRRESSSSKRHRLTHHHVDCAPSFSESSKLSSSRHGSLASRMDERERSRSGRSSRSRRRSLSMDDSHKKRHRSERKSSGRTASYEEYHTEERREGSLTRKKSEGTRETDDYSRVRPIKDSHGHQVKGDRHTIARHDDHRSTPSETDRDRDRDRELDHGRSKKSSRRHNHSRMERESSRRTSRDRERTKERHWDKRSEAHEEEDDDLDDIWVEKESGTAATADPTEATTSSRKRPRAAAFF